MFFGRLLFSGLLLAEKKWFPEKKAILPLAVLAFSACGYLIGQRYKLPLNVDIALYTMIFFYAGYCFRRTDGIEKSSVSLGLVLVAVWFLAFRLDGVELAARIYGSFPRCILTAAGAVAGSLLVFYASRELVERCKPLECFLGYCGKNSMVILLLHYLDGRVYDLNWFAPQLEQAGFQITPFGRNTLRVEAVPAMLPLRKVGDFVQELLRVFTSGEVRLTRVRSPFEPFARQLARQYAQQEDMTPYLQNPMPLLAALLECEIPYCSPGGKSTLLPFPMTELNRRFQN
jgi:hypothetical protein